MKRHYQSAHGSKKRKKQKSKKSKEKDSSLECLEVCFPCGEDSREEFLHRVVASFTNCTLADTLAAMAYLARLRPRAARLGLEERRGLFLKALLFAVLFWNDDCEATAVYKWASGLGEVATGDFFDAHMDFYRSLDYDLSVTQVELDEARRGFFETLAYYFGVPEPELKEAHPHWATSPVESEWTW